MKTFFVTIITLIFSQFAMAADHTPEHIIPLLKNVKISMQDGIALAEKSGALAISSKYEITGPGVLELSVYTVPEGINVEAENATLTELSGDASKTPFEFDSTIFSDKTHIARASSHLTIIQMSKFSLKEIVSIATAKNNGIAIDVRNPVVRNKTPVADVVVALPSGKATTVSVNLVTGKLYK